MTNKKLEKSAFFALKNWYSLIDSGNKKQARDQAQLVINMCKNVLKSVRCGVDPENRNKALCFGILFRGLQDFVDLTEITDVPDWITEHALIEKAWTKMWDCKERIEYASYFCHERTIEWVLSRIEFLEKVFFTTFGPGLYSSPEIIAKQEICNVCKNDFRSCDHIAGRIYDGIRCLVKPKDIQLRRVSIVEAPKDPRCRIWSWRLREDNTTEICIMTTFRMDDFIDES